MLYLNRPSAPTGSAGYPKQGAPDEFSGPNAAMFAGLVPLGLWWCFLLVAVCYWFLHGVDEGIFLVWFPFLIAYGFAFFVSGAAFLCADRRGLSNANGLPVRTQQLMRFVLFSLIAPWIFFSIVEISLRAKL
jgi:ribose/xylose/arabinose/galactoside ABC-type transport system permease subunit